MTAHQDEAARIAAGLTGAQRQWLPSFSEEWIGMLPMGMAKSTREKLATKGLVERDLSKHFGLVKWRLTPLGIAVRAHLTAHIEGSSKS